jgi:hypothetical protein
MSVAKLARDAHNGKTAAAKARPQPAPVPQGSSEQAKPSANGGNGRDGRGRFTVGNLGGPGNPFARRTAQLRKAFLEVANDENVEEVAAMLLSKALEGDVAAAKIWLAYVVGKPVEATNPDTLNHDEWQWWQDNATDPQALERVKVAVAAELAVKLARCTVRCQNETYRQHFVAVLRGQQAEREKAVSGQPSAVSQKEVVSGQPSAVSQKKSASTNCPAPMANGGNGRRKESTRGKAAAHWRKAVARLAGKPEHGAPITKGTNGASRRGG